MTIAAADSFIRQTMARPVLVQQINMIPDKAGLKRNLAELNLSFNRDEFETAYTNLLTCCQTIEQAESLKEIKLWWDCLEYTLEQAETDVS